MFATSTSVIYTFNYSGISLLFCTYKHNSAVKQVCSGDSRLPSQLSGLVAAQWGTRLEGDL